MFQAVSQKQNSTGVVRFEYGSSLHKKYGRPLTPFLRPSRNNLALCVPAKNPSQNLPPCRPPKFPVRSTEQSQFVVRVDARSRFIPLHRQAVWSPHNRSIRINDHDSATRVQLPVHGSPIQWCRRPSSTKLGVRKQLCQSSLQAAQQSARCDNSSKSICHDHSPSLAVPSILSQVAPPINTPTPSIEAVPPCDNAPRRDSRAPAEPELGDFSLEGLWRKKLMQLGWSERAAS